MRFWLNNRMSLLLFFFIETATTEISTLSLHDAFPISQVRHAGARGLIRLRRPDVELPVDLARVGGEHGNGLELRPRDRHGDRKSTRLNSSHSQISYAVFCLKKKILTQAHTVV